MGRDYRTTIASGSPCIFQSTRPVWGATHDAAYCADKPVISIHAPRMGRDYYNHNQKKEKRNFNPRAPYGARLTSCALGMLYFLFQSTRPVWGATAAVVSSAYAALFQSTRPVWGATKHCFYNTCNCVISIHAPRMGRDLSPRYWAHKRGTISIHAPRMGRDVCTAVVRQGQNISIHAPRMGRDPPTCPST